MRSLKILKNSERGVVLVTVVIIVLIMMIVTISIMSMTTNQALLTENESKRIQAEMKAEKGMYYLFADQLTDSPQNKYTPATEDIFTINAILDSSSAGISDTTPIKVKVSY